MNLLNLPFCWSPLLAEIKLPEQPSLYHWLAFAVLVVVLLTIDLGLFHRKSHDPSLRQAAIMTVVWCFLAGLFNLLIYFWRGPEAGMHFLTGYLLEWSLSMDNVFVFAVIFAFFKVPLRYQYRVLFWGILGAVVMRLTFVLVGSVILKQFAWSLPLFGLFLVYTGIKLAVHDDEQVDPDHNLLLRAARKVFPVAKQDHGNRFFVREAGRRCITPLFLVLLVIESTDVVFAVDSVPAIFGVTKDPFIVFTSNIFAILGLRALYFLLAGVMDLFRFLKYGLSLVLVFIGVKMVAEFAVHQWWGWEEEHHLMPAWVSLVVVVGLLGSSVAASLLIPHRPGHDSTPPT